MTTTTKSSTMMAVVEEYLREHESGRLSALSALALRADAQGKLGDDDEFPGRTPEEFVASRLRQECADLGVVGSPRGNLPQRMLACACGQIDWIAMAERVVDEARLAAARRDCPTCGAPVIQWMTRCPKPWAMCENRHAFDLPAPPPPTTERP